MAASSTNPRHPRLAVLVGGAGFLGITATFVIFVIGLGRGLPGPAVTPPGETPTATATMRPPPTPTIPGGPTETPAPEPTSIFEGISVEWTYSADDGQYALVDADEAGVIASFGEIYHGEVNRIAYLDPETGAERWRVDPECAPLYPSLSETVAVVPCTDGAVYAFALEDGEQLWRTDAGTMPVAPAVGGGMVFLDNEDPDGTYQLSVDPDQFRLGDVVALDLETGEERWRYELQSLRIFVTYADGRVFVTYQERPPGSPDGHSYGDSKLIALDAATGGLRWEAGNFDGNLLVAPKVYDGDVFVGGSSVIASFDAETGQFNWSSLRGAVDLAVLDGVMLASHSYAGESLYALNAKTGAEYWVDGNCDCGFRAESDGTRMVVNAGALYEIDPRTRDIAWYAIVQRGGVSSFDIAGDWTYAGTAFPGGVLGLRVP